MKDLFDASAAKAFKLRLATLRADSKRQWGRMNPAQAVAHCAMGLELAMGERRPPRTLFGRLAGWIVRPFSVGDDSPMRRNSRTVPGLAVEDERDLDKERKRLIYMIDRFVAGGPALCTTHPHSILGKLTPKQWAVLMFKHLDHHLRQFGV